MNKFAEKCCVPHPVDSCRNYFNSYSRIQLDCQILENNHIGLNIILNLSLSYFTTNIKQDQDKIIQLGRRGVRWVGLAGNSWITSNGIVIIFVWLSSIYIHNNIHKVHNNIHKVAFRVSGCVQFLLHLL